MTTWTEAWSVHGFAGVSNSRIPGAHNKPHDGKEQALHDTDSLGAAPDDAQSAGALPGRQAPPRLRKYLDGAALFRCPLCAAAGGSVRLRPSGSALRCTAGHTFDVSRKGYVNFMPSQKPLRGYTKEFFEARREFLSWGYYDHVLQAVSDVVADAMAKQAADRGFRLLDAGCAEGYYLRGIRRAIEAAPGNGPRADAGAGTLLIGADISKDAVRLAAGGGDPNLWIVSDVANLALADSSVDCVLNVFTPANYHEFRRVLRPGGVLVKVVPGPRHLEQLRQAVGEAAHSEDDVVRIFRRNCDMEADVAATRTFDVPHERMSTLIGMTPFAFGFDERQRRDIMVRRITIDARVLVGVPHGAEV